MQKLAILAIAAMLGLLGALIATSFFGESSGPTVSADLGGDQADSVRFQNLFPFQPDSSHVYCGVQVRSEPYVLDVVVTNPPNPDPVEDPQDPFDDVLPSHEGAGWLRMFRQDSVYDEGDGDWMTGTFDTFLVPANSSFSFSLTLGGVPGVDQIVSFASPPKGDTSGGGADFSGWATVQAQRGAVDPFIGDGRNDNFCVSAGPGGEFPSETLSTTLPVPDNWVVDGDGSDGGVLH